MVKYGLPERVYVENEWYDGPRAGVSDIDGIPYRFKSLFDEGEDQYLGTFMVWPIDLQMLDLEIEQWCIFVEWNTRFELGQVDTDSHPGHGGRNVRWDELEARLKLSRSHVPAQAKPAHAELKPIIDRKVRYAPSGPAYTMCWNVARTDRD